MSKRKELKRVAERLADNLADAIEALEELYPKSDTAPFAVVTACKRALRKARKHGIVACGYDGDKK
jgi:hypothetical protein